MYRLKWVVIFLVAAAASTGFPADWPQWRGPNGDGTTPERLLADSAEANPEIEIVGPIWKGAVGEGCSSVIVADGALYATGWREGRDVVSCLDAATGEVRWTRQYDAPRYGRHAVGDQGFYSGPTATPALDPESKQLYTLGADGELRCWDTARQGELVWAVNLYDRYGVGRRPDVGGGRRDYGFTTAPLIHGPSLLVTVGGEAGLVVAFDKRTGKPKWASQHRGPAGHAGGMAKLTVDGLPCLAVLSLRELFVMRIDPGHEGRTLATYPWSTHYGNNLVTPTAVGSGILLSSGYNLSRTVLLSVTKDGIEAQWQSEPYSGVGSPVVHQGRVYFAYRQLHCLDLASGRRRWRGGRFGSDGSCLLTADGYVVAFGDGRLVIAATDRRSGGAYRPFAERGGLARRNESWPHVVFAHGNLYCRDRRGNLMAFQVRVRD